jgi:CAAX protease family protein
LALIKFELNSFSTDRTRKKALIILFIGGSIMYYPLLKYLYRYFALNKDTGFLKELGFFSGPSGLWYSWIIALIIGFGYAYFTAKKVPAVRDNWTEVSLFNLFGVYLAISASVIEEAFFRRAIMDNFFENYPVIIQIALSGMIFGLAHGVWGILGSFRIAWEAIKATSILGMLLAALYVVADRSLAPCIIAHFISVAIIEPWLVVGMIKPKR